MNTVHICRTLFCAPSRKAIAPFSLYRSLYSQEKKKVRASRVNYFNVPKRKDPQPHSSTRAADPGRSPSALITKNKRLKSSNMSSSNASPSQIIVRFYDPEIQAKDAHGRTQENILSWSDGQWERCHNYIQMLFPLPEGSMFNWEAPVIDKEVMLAFRSRSGLRDRLRQSFERMLTFYGFTTLKTPIADGNEEDGESNDMAEDMGISNSAAASSRETAATSNVTNDCTESATEGNDFPFNKLDSANSLPSSDHSQGKVTISTPYRIVRGPNFDKNSRNWAVRVDHNHLRITRILRSLRVLGLQEEAEAFFEALQEVFDEPSIRISDNSMMYWTRAVERPLYVAPDGDKCTWLKKWEEEQEY
ncbi:hypothetical protein ACN47E_006111 [Coniothyrium glycines]